MKALILGASAGLGRSLAQEAAAKGHDLFLVASDARDLEVQARDLKLRFGVDVRWQACRITPDGAWLEPLAGALEQWQGLSALFFPIGYSSESDQQGLPEQTLRQIIEANFTGVVSLVSRLEPVLARAAGDGGLAWVVGFGSIAAIRGRGQNRVYSAAKRGLQSYFESLRHSWAGDGQATGLIRVQYYQIGYMDTQQSFGKKLLFPAISPGTAARKVFAGLDRNFGVRYLPGFWRYIGWVLSALPWVIFKRLKF